MIVIELMFPAGRFHATPWGRHMTEGVAEWPPSPYRLVRALLDAWFRNRPEWPKERVEPILEALAAKPPCFHLPPATRSHIRTYMHSNIFNIESMNSKQKVFDAFVCMMPGDAVLMGWPDAALTEDQTRDLADLLGLLDYFGRSESLVDAGVLHAPETPWNCVPHEGGEAGPEFNIVPVACPTPKPEYEKSAFTRFRNAKSWFDALCASTSEMQANRWSSMPGLTQVPYLLSTRCFDIVRTPKDVLPGRKAQGVLYALHSRVLPPVTETVSVADAVRSCVMGAHKRIVGSEDLVSVKFLGKEENGTPLRGDHRHTYFLPMDQDRDGFLDHVLVIGKDDLTADEMKALHNVKFIWQSRSRPEIRCVPVRWASMGEFAGTGRVFRSTTPFCPPRYFRKGRGAPGMWAEEELRAALAHHGIPAPISIKPVRNLDNNGATRQWADFQRNRKSDAPKLGFGFEIEFEKPVSNLLAVGYAAHFGLGQFKPIA